MRTNDENRYENQTKGSHWNENRPMKIAQALT
jgi:hypothetical protein